MDGMVLTEAAAGEGPSSDQAKGRHRRIEVITRAERRRSWSVDEKREIVVASLRPGVRAGDVARERGISSGQLYTWRRQMLEGQLGEAAQPLPSFARVEIAAQAEPLPPPRITPASSAQPAPPLGPPPPPAAPPAAPGRIEIALPSGITVRIDAEVDMRALRRVLAALEGR
jgi:transposase